MKNINTRDGTKIEDKKTKINLPAGIAGTYGGYLQKKC
jgi:hypothetical protein